MCLIYSSKKPGHWISGAQRENENPFKLHQSYVLDLMSNWTTSYGHYTNNHGTDGTTNLIGQSIKMVRLVVVDGLPSQNSTRKPKIASEAEVRHRRQKASR
jgi:hypothetical protein